MYLETGDNFSLGDREATYGPNRETLGLLLVGLIFCGIGAVVALALGFAQTYARDQALMGGVGGLMGLIGAGFGWAYLRLRRARVDVYVEGLVLTQSGRRQLSCRWDEVRAVYIMPVYYNNTRYTFRTLAVRCRIQRQTGERLQLGVSFANSEALSADIQRHTTPLLLAPALAAYEAGDAVSFGPHLLLSQYEITCRGATLPWQEVAAFKVGRDVRIVRKGERRPWRILLRNQVANYQVLEALAERIASGTLASAGVLPPGERGIGALSARLGVDVRDLLLEGYTTQDLQGVLQGICDLDELRRRGPRRAK